MLISRAQFRRGLPRALVGFAASIPLFFIALMLSRHPEGGIHFTGMIFCFPFASLIAILFPYGSWPLLALMWLMLFGQLPVYFVILGDAQGRKRLIWRAILLLLLHAVFVTICFTLQAIEDKKDLDAVELLERR